ncbi:MAG: hypothetical protein KF754_02385 [Planctomycetes bacterium]|nr:hypothetical protein [Planctomycetota bacterium]
MALRAHNRPALIAMILAALACYANAPRLAATLMVGDAVNLAAVADSLTRQSLRAHLQTLPADSADARQLAQRLDDGETSHDLCQSLPAIDALLAPAQVRATIDQPQPDSPRAPQAAPATHWALQPGAVLTTSLPPPPDTGRAARSHGTPRTRGLQVQPRAPPCGL